MQSSQPYSRHSGFGWAIPLALLMLALAMRTVLAMGMPVQWLEGWSIHLAQNVMAGRIYSLPAESMRWLSGPVHALMMPVGPEGIWLLRIFSGLLGTLNVAICIRLGKELDSWFAGLVAALIYTLLPFTVFHERQAIIDPLQATFTSLALLFSVKLARRPHRVLAFAIGLVLAGGFLTKVSALPFLGIPIWAIMTLAPPRNRRQGVAFATVAISITIIIIVAGLAPFTRYNPEMYPSLRSVLIDPFIGLSPVDQEADQAAYLMGVLKSLGQAVENTNTYIGPAVSALALFSILALRDRLKRGAILFLIIPGLLFPLAPALSDSSRITYRDTYYAARYMLTSAVPIVLLAAISLRHLLNTSGYRVRHSVRWGTALALLGCIIVPALVFDATLIFAPLHTPLPQVDRWQYITGRPSGVGYDDAARAVLNVWDDNHKQPVHLVVTGNAMQLRGYLGPMVGDVIEFDRRNEDQIEIIADWLVQGDTVLFFDGNLRRLLPQNPHGAQLDPIGNYETRWGGTLNVYRVVGAETRLADRIAAQQTLRPDRYDNR